MKFNPNTSRGTAPKVSRPVLETLSEAEEYDKRVSRYRRAGFCDVCAAQASWGHQLGFSNVRPPFETCAGLTPPPRTGARAARWAGEATELTAPTEHAERPTAAQVTTCLGCGQQWTALGAAHCTGCHAAPFATVSLFDQHRSPAGEGGSCRNPEEIVNRAGERAMFLRDGMWRRPEMDEATKVKRFGRAS